MSDSNQNELEQDADTKADVGAILIIFGALILFAVHFVSGFTFDLV